MGGTDVSYSRPDFWPVPQRAQQPLLDPDFHLARQPIVETNIP